MFLKVKSSICRIVVLSLALSFVSCTAETRPRNFKFCEQTSWLKRGGEITITADGVWINSDVRPRLKIVSTEEFVGFDDPPIIILINSHIGPGVREWKAGGYSYRATQSKTHENTIDYLARSTAETSSALSFLRYSYSKKKGLMYFEAVYGGDNSVTGTRWKQCINRLKIEDIRAMSAN